MFTIVMGLFLIEIAHASGTGTIPLANPIVSARTSVGSTQLIHLEKRGSLLAAAVKGSCMSWIAVDATGAEALRLVLRERQLPGNRCLVQITSPMDREGLIHRVTLFSESTSVRIFHVEEGEWREASLVRFPVPSEVGTHTVDATGAPFGGLGLFLFDRSGSLDAGLKLPPPELGAFDHKIRLARGSWHLIWSGIALFVFVWISRQVHSRTAQTL